MDTTLDAIRILVVGVLAEIEKDRVRTDTKIRTLEADGFRIIDGGQTGDRDDAGEAIWQNIDWRTREVLSEGVGYEAYTASADETWYHVDHVDDGEKFFEALTTLKESSGLPPSLASALTEWAEENPDDAIELVSAPPDKDAVMSLIHLGAFHGYAISFRPTRDERWEVGWMQGRHGGWFGFTADSLTEAAKEAVAKDLPDLLAERSSDGQ
ncbi:hypothetical protein ACWCOV_26745 [Kribbella sp. NPDC002412]